MSASVHTTSKQTRISAHDQGGQLGAIARRRWRLAIAMFAVPTACALGLAVYLPSLYESRALVLVDPPTTEGALEISATRIEQLTKENLSQPRLVALLDALHEPSGDGAAQALRRDLDIETEKVNGPTGQTSIGVSVRVRALDADRAARIANELAGYYVESERTRLQQQASTLEAQIKDAHVRLVEQEDHLKDFEVKHLRELPEQVQVHLASLDSLNAQLEMIRTNRARTLERAHAASERMATAPVAAPVDPDDAELARMRAQLAALRVHYSDKHPDVVRMRATIENFEAHRQPKAVAPSAQPPAVNRASDVDAELRTWSDEERAIESRIASVQHEALNAARTGQERATLLPGYEAARATYTELLRRYNDLQAKRGDDGGRVPFHVVEAALPAHQGVLPNRPRLAGLGIIFAALAALSAVWLREQLDRSFHTSSELREFTRIPVLGHIPRIVTDADRRRRRWRTALGGVLLALMLLGVIVGTRAIAANPEVLRMVTRTGAP